VNQENRLRAAWTSCRKFFPLVGARILEEGGDISFVVDETRLSEVTDENFVVLPRSGPLDAQTIRESISNPEPYGTRRILSNDHLTKLYVLLSPPDDSDTTAAGWITHNVLFASCHSISDAAGVSSIARAFFEFLVGPQSDEAEARLPTLEERLAAVPAMEQVFPAVKQSWAARRWRWAIARIFYELETSRYQVVLMCPFSSNA
jgi:hypothetical protein